MAVLDFHVEDPNEKPGNVTTQLVHDAFASVDTEVLSNLVDHIFAKLFISKDTYRRCWGEADGEDSSGMDGLTWGNRCHELSNG